MCLSFLDVFWCRTIIFCGIRCHKYDVVGMVMNVCLVCKRISRFLVHG
jgi:hypothetical protein